MSPMWARTTGTQLVLNYLRPRIMSPVKATAFPGRHKRSARHPLAALVCRDQKPAECIENHSATVVTPPYPAPSCSDGEERYERAPAGSAVRHCPADHARMAQRGTDTPHA